jgi:UDPglucose 6-dehydrogenase
MKLAMVGTGYVGLVTGTCFAQMGNTVTCVDIDEKKVAGLRNGIIPIYEPGLEALVQENVKNKSLTFTTSLEDALKTAEVVFIAVGTPMGEDGSADLQYVLKVATDIGRFMVGPVVVVDKSTVPVGTADKVKAAIAGALKARGVTHKFAVVSNPEFLKEGAAIDDFMKPDRVVIGADDPEALETMRELYGPFTFSRDRFIGMDVRSAEMTKYAANAMLATKISFMNEVANICERVGADVNKVRVGIGSDARIGYSFIYPGCGYGGSCFPKDVRALEKTALDHGYTPRILQAVEGVNKDQKKVLGAKVVKRFGEDLKGHTFAVWGLAFKPETDDMREASALTLIDDLTRRGAQIAVYDPKAMDEAKKHYLAENKAVRYCESKYDALNGASALLLVTEWKEFRSPDFDEIGSRLKQKVIIDGRNQYQADRITAQGFEYHPIGVRTGIQG